MPDFLADVTLADAARWAAAAAALVVVVRKVWPWLSRLKDFLDDLMGEPERPGVPARPGVMTRLAQHEVDIAEIRVAAQQAAHHSQPNGGSSAYDQLIGEVRSARKELADHIAACGGTPPVAVVVQTGDVPPAA